MSTAVSTIDLWAASKFIGRECATVNKDYVLCKQAASADPAVCAKQGDLVTSCVNKVVSELKTKYPAEFNAFGKCLDDNDFRFGDCRKLEKALLACWNNDAKN